MGAALARRLSASHEVRVIVAPGGTPAPPGTAAWTADLTSIPEAEVALAGAKIVVMLAQARHRPARATYAALDDVDRLLADSVARAAKRCGAGHLVSFSCTTKDARGELLGRAGVPLTTLTGGGPDPIEQLAALVEAGPGAASQTTLDWSGAAPRAAPRAGLLTCSVQRWARPAGWNAEKLARSYFSWLSEHAPMTRVKEHGGVFSLHLLGMRALVLRHVPGRSEDDSFFLEVADGSLTRRDGSPARFEFRVLLDGTSAMAALVGFRPALPWPLYRATQALVHERTMRQFGAWLSQQA